MISLLWPRLVPDFVDCLRDMGAVSVHRVEINSKDLGLLFQDDFLV